jgi:hypothetical protein
VNAREQALHEPVSIEMTAVEWITLHAAAKTLLLLEREQGDVALRRGGDLHSAAAKIRERFPGLTS